MPISTLNDADNARPLITARGRRMYEIGTHLEHPVTLSDEERRRHLYLIGRTGTGKSTLLQNLMRQDLQSGRGFVLIDPHGDLAKGVADSVPSHRLNDVLYFDPMDTHVMGFNPLSHTGSSLQRATVANQLVAAFKHVKKEFFDLPFWGSQSEPLLRNALRLLLDRRGSTLIEITRIFSDTDFRERLIAKCEDEHIKKYWERDFLSKPQKQRDDLTSPIRNIVDQFTTDPILRAVVGGRSTFSPLDLMNKNKVLLCNFSKTMGEDPAHLLGAFLVTAIYQAAASRSTRGDFALYVDEFQNFATSTFATILSEARKFGLNLVVAHQFLGQIGDHLRQAVIGNAGTLAVFRIGAEDAPLLARELGTDPVALTDTPNYQAWIKRADAHLVAIPPPVPATGSYGAILTRTRARYARPRSS